MKNMNKSGFLIINKPKGISSFRVIAKLRRITGVKKIGHAGTLDPMATGVLICGVGREATRLLDDFHKFEKEYEAVIRLDGVSATYDARGIVTKLENLDRPKKQKIIKVIEKYFSGEIRQRPPIFSAKKIHGQPAYKLALKGREVKLKKVWVSIKKFDVLSYKWPYLKVKVECSSGTYIRSLANDLGKKLKIGGYLTKLERIRIGDFDIKKSVKLDQINKKNWSRKLVFIDKQ
jgi:tRNA pseudouridine55 synthase